MPALPAMPIPSELPRSLHGVRRAYLVGIGGVGMSGAALLLERRGIEVLGSDRSAHAANLALRRLGGTVQATSDEQPLPADVDLLVYSAAIAPEHPQRQAARARGLTCWRYADLLGVLMADRLAICVSGSHGKTTTSSLVASSLLHAGRDPGFLIGGRLLEHGSGARAGAGDHFVAESCEFDRSFHAHRPRVAIVTNVDADHLDYYRDLAEIQESFRVFAARLPANGHLVVNEAYAPLFEGDARIKARLQVFGFGPEAPWRAADLRLAPDGRTTHFTFSHRGLTLGSVQLPLLGSHNVLNAAAAITALMVSGLPFAQASAGVAAFKGVGRRLELIGEPQGVRILDDYAHHPAEIRAVLRAVRPSLPGRRLLVIFQPHQASRTRCLLREFAAALAEADEAWLPPIYFSRDSAEERRRVTHEDLAASVRNEGGVAHAFADLAEVQAHARGAVRPGDVVITMGAGNIDEVARGLAEQLS